MKHVVWVGGRGYALELLVGAARSSRPFDPEAARRGLRRLSLDPRGRRGLIKLINELDGTRVLASHDLEMIRETCGRVLLIDEGRLVVEGPTDAVLSDAPLMERHGLEVPYSLQTKRGAMNEER